MFAQSRLRASCVGLSEAEGHLEVVGLPFVKASPTNNVLAIELICHTSEESADNFSGARHPEMTHKILDIYALFSGRKSIAFIRILKESMILKSCKPLPSKCL